MTDQGTSLQELRECVRLLAEEPQPGEIGPTNDLALFIDSSRHDTSYVLYSPRYYAASIKQDVAAARDHFNAIKFKDDLGSFKNYYSFSNVQEVFSDPVGIYGYLIVNEGRMVGMSNSCNRANEVRNIAAREGYGTIMYLIGMTVDPPIMASRTGVSDNARDFWAHFDQDRARLDVTRFKDEKALHKKTPQDCEVYRDKPLDQSYKVKRPIDIAPLKHKHELFLEQMKSFLKRNDVDFVKTRVEGYIGNAGWSFYGQSE